MPDAPLTAADVISAVAERNIRFIRMWCPDVLGQLKAFSINVTELADAFEGGMGFDGSSITGFNAIEESDMIAQPDPSTFVPLPARRGDGLRPFLRRSRARVLLLPGLEVDRGPGRGGLLRPDDARRRLRPA